METFIGGLRIGESYFSSLNFTYPLSSIEFQDGGLMIKYPVGKYLIPFSNINSIALYSGFYSKGLRIEHSVDHVPGFVVFWHMNNQYLIERIRLSKIPMQLTVERSPKTSKTARNLMLSWLIFIARTIFMFIAFFVFDIAQSRDVPEALLDAFGFTVFINIAVSILLFFKG